MIGVMRVLFGLLAVGFVSTACADDVVLANEFMRLEFAGEDTGFGVLSVSDLSADG